jgi:hypothetical protein
MIENAVDVGYLSIAIVSFVTNVLKIMQRKNVFWKNTTNHLRKQYRGYTYYLRD